MEVFENGERVIIWGDAIKALSQNIPDCSVDLIFADPPYNIGKNFSGRKDKWESEEAYLQWCYEWLDLCIRKIKDTGSFYLMAATQNMPYFDIYLRDKAHILSRIVWYYDSSGVQAKKYYGSLYEPILFCVKNKENYTFNAQECSQGSPTPKAYGFCLAIFQSYSGKTLLRIRMGPTLAQRMARRTSISDGGSSGIPGLERSGNLYLSS